MIIYKYHNICSIFLHGVQNTNLTTAIDTNNVKDA